MDLRDPTEETVSQMNGVSRVLLGVAAMAGVGSVSRLEGGGAEIRRAVLENGLEVLLVPKEGVPLVTVEVAVRAGAFVETPELDGLTHLHEHMFFKANEAIPDQETYLRRLDELGMNWNGSTSHEVVRYFFTLPSGLLEEGLEFMRDAIQTPLFLEDELEKERKVVIGEYDRSEARPEFHLWQALQRALFGKYYSRKNVIGDREVILSATRQKLELIQSTFYVPNNAALILSGEFEPARGLELADAMFGHWERRPDPFDANPVPRHPPLLENDHLVVSQPVQGASIRVGWHGPSVSEEPEETVVADVLYQMLAQPTHPFRRALVDSGLATDVSLSYYTLKYTGPITLAIETRPETALGALEVAREQLDALARGALLDEESLRRAQRDLVNEEIFEREKAREFAITLGFWWSVGGTEYYVRYPEMVESVTLEDVRSFVRRYLSRNHVVVAMVSDEASEAHGIRPETLRQAFDRREGEARERELQKIDLASGASLVVSRSSSASVAAFQVHFRGTVDRVTTANAGIEELLLNTLADRFKRDHLDVLNRLGVRLSVSANPDYSTLAVECLRPSLEQAIELTAEALLRQSFSEEDMERNRARMVTAYRKTMEDPDRRVVHVVNQTFFPPGHPYRAYPGGTEESLRSLSLADLAAHRHRLLAARQLLFVGVGDVDADSLRAAIERHFGSLEPGESTPGDVPELAGAAETRLSVEPRDIPTNYVIGRFRAPAPGEPDHEALQLALRILSRRLWLEVRSKRALTYAVASGMSVRARSMGYLYVSTTRPGLAVEVMLDTVDELISTPISETDLRAAALTSSTAEYLRMEAPGEQASRLARETILRGDPGAAFRIVEALEPLRPADIQAVLEKYVRNIHFGVLGPADELDAEIFRRK